MVERLEPRNPQGRPSAVASGAEWFMKEVAELESVGVGPLKLSHVLACGGQGVVFLGVSRSGSHKVAVKVPVGFIAQSRQALAGGPVEGFHGMVEASRRECEWHDRLQHLGLLPRKLFPKRGDDPVVTLPHHDALVPLLVMDYAPGLSLRELLLSMRDRAPARHIAVRGTETGESGSRDGAALARTLVGILEGLGAILDAGGVYLDLAPENFLLGRVGGGPVILDAGSIVDRHQPGEIPIRMGLIPQGLSAQLKRAHELRDEEIQQLQVGMLAKAVATTLLAVFPDGRWDPSSRMAARKVPGDEWLEDFFERAICGWPHPFATIAEAAAFLRKRGRDDTVGRFPLRISFLPEALERIVEVRRS